MKIICVSGKAQHGKDFTANCIKQCLESKGKKVLIAHYADLLKYLCKQYFGWNGEKDDTGRALLQRVGTDEIRKIHPDYWVDFLVSFFKMFPNEWDYVVLADTRFPNEIEKWKTSELECVSVRVERVGFMSSLTKEQQNHASETALDGYDFDYYLVNGGTEWYKEQVDKFVNEVLIAENN